MFPSLLHNCLLRLPPDMTDEDVPLVAIRVNHEDVVEFNSAVACESFVGRINITTKSKFESVLNLYSPRSLSEIEHS